MRIALVHDWLTGMRGGERCLEVLCKLWPDAHLYTLIYNQGQLSPAIERMDIRTSFLQKIRGIHERYRYFLPLMPAAIERFQLEDYDLVISLSHCVAKSVRVRPGTPHVCYCLTPMRYAWHLRDAYFAGPGPDSYRSLEQESSRTSLRLRARGLGENLRSVVRRSLLVQAPLSVLLWRLRRWDARTAGRVTHFVAISRTVRRRIRECYGRVSEIISPPVRTDFYTPGPVSREAFYLCVSALSPYKRLDLAVQACTQLRKRLVLIGTGPEEARLRKIAGPSVIFLGWQPDATIRGHYRRCRALLFPGIEDFGIVPLEAQACGTPVIAYAAGGATETVIPASRTQAGTGRLFPTQSVASLVEAIEECERGQLRFSPELARQNAEQYCESRFAAAIQAIAEESARGNRPESARGADTLVAA
jgi:glycosyltransferase involved in cell wall biosynthesis